ncbi:MAG TPA: serine protease [Cyanobacteria bacterium UBA11149]|nr:serine protease [Cyanobacteria bacterium UBA11367]HBE58236.1 serine protease [Cyanobacteria bacterium UBA11366]HBK66955.1 serine protease [Cyanobacteria bacterium UBA11166]HBR75023.1 serine protease [Cyanobacteria bacterium UBA11159]HBS70762.1 serine protease [Cyanobacteria bacterium UBA11153]HBW88024.1 serine protease [Cyanobacteria bacterium UBA11149]HCA95893.1 serine protease [Cyanobacteria bacterium UBA9226]
MTVQLSQPDFQRLTRIVQKLPDFANVRDRRRLVAGALEGVPQVDLILARLDLDGSPMGVSVEVMRFLSQFGQVAYGKEALSVFLNYIQPFAGDQDSDFILELFQKYPLDVPATPSRLIDRWRGMSSVADVQEKIIGENTLRHIYILNLALEAAKAVVHLRLPKGAGTGFMIAPDLLMTNNHVIASLEEAEQTEYTFNYQLDINGKECEIQTAQALPGGAFYTNPELDYTVVSLEDLPSFGSPLILKSKQVQRDDRVAIIQHPGGHLKKISIQNNFVAYADSKVVQYTTSTLPGSSGSPVFDDEFKVVAIHHSGGMLVEPGTQQHYLRNAGTSMIAVLKDLQINAPEIYARLQG